MPTQKEALTEYVQHLRKKMDELPIIYNQKGRRLLPSEIDPNNYITPKHKP